MKGLHHKETYKKNNAENDLTCRYKLNKLRIPYLVCSDINKLLTFEKKLKYGWIITPKDKMLRAKCSILEILLNLVLGLTYYTLEISPNVLVSFD